MKREIITPVTLLAVLAGTQLVTPADRQANTATMEDYAFDPSTYRQNLCGPRGAKRGAYFKPDLASLLFQTANASEPTYSDVPLFAGLGLRDFTISSNNSEAQAYFRQGFSLLYGFNHWEAIRAFKKAQTLDPKCAICFWGEAIALGPNINAAMDEASGLRALAATETAVALKENANDREKALIEAASVRYSADATISRSDLDQRYADAMAIVHGRFPKDQDIATLYAEALMDTSPWNYWERDFVTPRSHIQTALDVINGVLGENPDHYGAIHLHIHLYEASVQVQQSEIHADRLAALSIASGHLTHMPSHIYFRIGRYLDSLEVNKKAAEIDADYLAQTKGSSLYRYGYYPHNAHFVLVSAQMAEDRETALEYAEILDGLLPVDKISQAAWLPPIKAAPYFAYAQFGQLEDVEALPNPGDDFPYLQAMWHYARGKVFAEAGDDRAWEEQEAIERLMGHRTIQSADIPAAAILEIAANTIAAKRLMAGGNYDGAVELLNKSVLLQNSLGYLEPPFWYYAAEQSLGAAYYLGGDYEQAEQAFKASLIRHPNSTGSLFGLWQTQVKLGLDAEAEFTRQLLSNATHDVPDLSFLKL